jgi:hypothetical protein
MLADSYKGVFDGWLATVAQRCGLDDHFLAKPTVGDEKSQLRPGTRAAPGGRTDSKITRKIEQLQVAASGDMAYEYSTYHFSYVRTSDKQKFELDGASLRVWRKLDGRWRIVATFQRPFDDSPSPR